MKIVIASLIGIIGFVIFMPQSEVHEAKLSRFVEKSSTFTEERVLADPELAMHNIRKDLEKKIKRSKEYIYSLSKEKNKLQLQVRSSFGQADMLRELGNESHKEWKDLTLQLGPIISSHTILLDKVEALKISKKAEDRVLLKDKKKELRSIERTKEDLAYKIADLDLKMSDLFWRIEEHERVAQDSRVALTDNLKKTRAAFEIDTALKKTFYKAESVESAAAMAGTGSGLTTEGASKILENMAEIESIEELLERENNEILALNHPLHTERYSNDEVLELIHSDGF